MLEKSGRQRASYAPICRQRLHYGAQPVASERRNSGGEYLWIYSGCPARVGRYDIAACLNVEECADFEKERWIPGVYDVEVVDYQKPCRAYLWNVSGRSRGLIVDIEDKEGVRSAEEAYNNKEYML